MENLPQILIPALKDQKTKTGSDIRKCEEKLKELKQQEAFLDKVIQFGSDGFFQHIVALFQKEAKTVKALKEANAEISARLDELLSLAGEQSIANLRRFPMLLQKACEKEQMEIDSSSSHPRYSLFKNFFQLEINEAKKTALLRIRGGRPWEMPCDIEAIIRNLKAEHKRIFSRTFDEQKFLRKIYKSYSDVVRKQKKQMGDSIPVLDIVNAFRGKEKTFRNDEFLFDLSRLIKKGTQEIDGYRLDLQHTKDTDAGVLIYEREGGGYIGYIIFRRLNNA